MADFISVIHVRSDFLHEFSDLLLITLLTTREVLAGKLGNPNLFAEGGMHVFDVVNKILRISPVEVYRQTIDLLKQSLSEFCKRRM